MMKGRIFLPNELIWFLFALVNFGLIVFIYYFFGKIGLIAWIAMGTILANIQVVKSIELFSLTATLGNIMYGTIFLATDVLNEKYDEKTAKMAVYVGFFINLSSVIIMQIALAFHPSIDTISMNDSLKTIFNLMPRIFIASLIAYLVSQLLDVILFQRIKRRWPSDKLLWVRNNVSTLISQAVDTVIFVTFAFSFNHYFTGIIFWEVMLTTYLIKAVVALLDTPFIYLMKKIIPLNERA